MSLLEHTTINCVVPGNPVHLAVLCCLAAMGTWSPVTHRCMITETNAETMRDSLWEWNDCVRRAAWVNDTLAGVLEASGPMCLPADPAPALAQPAPTKLAKLAPAAAEGPCTLSDAYPIAVAAVIVAVALVAFGYCMTAERRLRL